MTLKSQITKITIFTKLRFWAFVPHPQKCKQKISFLTILFTLHAIFDIFFGRYIKIFRPLRTEHRKGNGL